MRIRYLSYIRAVACIAIVILHTVDAALMLYGDQLPQAEQTAAKSVVYCMMFAVPAFVMVTGALLLKKERNVTLKVVFGKYILRVLLALFVFSEIFSLFDTLMNKDGAGAGFLLRGLWNTVTGRGWAHLWYLYLLIGLYLFLVFYRAVAHHVSDREYRYLLIVYAVFLSVLPILQIWRIPFGFYIHVSTIYPFFLFAGYALAEGKLKISSWLSVLLILAGLAGLVLSTFASVRNERILNGNLLDYSSVFVLLLSVGFFALMKNCLDKEKIISKKPDLRTTVYELKKPNALGRILLELDRCSFGIYLIHMLFVRLILRYWMVDPFAIRPSAAVFAGLIIGIVLISYGITFLLKLIPGVKKIV